MGVLYHQKNRGREGRMNTKQDKNLILGATRNRGTGRKPVMVPRHCIYIGEHFQKSKGVLRGWERGETPYGKKTPKGYPGKEDLEKIHHHILGGAK